MPNTPGTTDTAPTLPDWLQSIVDANDDLLLTHEGFLWGQPLWACMSGDCTCTFVYSDGQFLDRYSLVTRLDNGTRVWCPDGQDRGCACHSLPSERPGADEGD